MNKLNLIIFLLCSNIILLAHDSIPDPIQRTEIKTHHSIIIAPAYNYHKFLDQQLSPIVYKGNLFGLNLGYESDGEKHKYSLVLNGFYGQLLGKTHYATYFANQSIVNLYGSYYHHTNLDKNYQLFLGSIFNHQLILYNNPNLQNAALTMSILNSLSISACLEKTLVFHAKSLKIWFIKYKTKDRLLKFSFSLNLPILFYNFRPPYSTISDFSNDENNWDLKSKFYNISAKVFRANTKTSITYYLQNNNALRISYIWDAFSFKDTFYSYQAAQHIFEVSLLFNLN